MKMTLTFVCTMSAIFAIGAAQKPSAKKTSFSESELRTLAQAVPDVKTAGQLFTVAMAASNNVEQQQAYLKVAAACLVACDRTDIYIKYVKDKLQDVAEFEGELEDECTQCSGSGNIERRCSICRGNGQCPTCKGTGQVKTMATASFSFNKLIKPCSKCNESGRCPKCDGEGSTKGKCLTCAGTGKAFSKNAAARIFHDSCKKIADGHEERNPGPQRAGTKLTTESKGLLKKEKRLAADRLAVVRKAEESFKNRFTAFDDAVQVEYRNNIYGIVENTLGDENFIVLKKRTYDGDDIHFMILPTPDSRNRWYAAVVECVNKIKSWICIAAENKVEQVSKDIPIYATGASEEVYAYVNVITRGRGQVELLHKVIRNPVASRTTQLVKFVGSIRATDDTFTKWEVAIQMKCGDSFRISIFDGYGALAEIENKFVEFLTFTNPKNLENARKIQSKKEELFR